MSATESLVESASAKLSTLISYAGRIKTLGEERHLQKARREVQRLKFLEWSPMCYENPVEQSIEARYSSECEDFASNFQKICHIVCPQYGSLQESDSEESNE